MKQEKTGEHTDFEDLVTFLEAPASYAHRPSSVRLIQTHISCVAIAPPYVYKLKKPVSFGFLDFSTLARRRHYCHEEVRLNRRLCSDTYLDVLPISRTPDGLAFADGPEVVDYVVRMNWLPPEGFLDRKLSEGRVSHEDLDRVALALTAFYAGQQPRAEVSKWGHIDQLRVSTDENFEQTESFGDDLYPSAGFRAIRSFTGRFYRENAALFDRRVAEGRILDCHGDLHLEHIHASEKGLCIYDCIEFNERFRCIDVASDIAFLAMDLEHKGRPDLAGYFTTKMASMLGDPDMAKLLPFYTCYRAFVRGKVAGMKSREGEVDAEDRRRAREQAASYFRLALRIALGAPPRVIVTMGRSGSGKSTLARILAESTGWTVISSDVERKTLAGAPLYERGSAEERRVLYAPEHTERTYEAMLKKAKASLERGKSVIVEATFSRRKYRDAWREQLFEGPRERIVFFEARASEAVLKRRLAERDHRTDEVSDARLEDFALLNERYDAPVTREENDVFAVSSEKAPQETAFDILHVLSSARTSEKILPTA